MELSATASVIRGMVSRAARSGHAIPELKRLAEAGLIEGVDAPRGERKRTVYAITSEGEAALKEWLRQAPATYEMREEGLLKLFFAGVLPPAEAAEILRCMREHRAGLAERLRALEPLAAERREGDDPYPLMVLRAGSEFNEWFVGWCERMEAALRDPVREKVSS